MVFAGPARSSCAPLYPLGPPYPRRDGDNAQAPKHLRLPGTLAVRISGGSAPRPKSKASAYTGNANADPPVTRFASGAASRIVTRQARHAPPRFPFVPLGRSPTLSQDSGPGAGASQVLQHHNADAYYYYNTPPQQRRIARGVRLRAGIRTAPYAHPGLCARELAWHAPASGLDAP